MSRHRGADVDLWVSEQMFEEDVRAVLNMLRPHGRERLQGWKEYRTGGAHFRVTVSWDGEFEAMAEEQPLSVPHMADVLECLLVGSARLSGDQPAIEEVDHYRQVIRELYRRINEMESCYL